MLSVYIYITPLAYFISIYYCMHCLLQPINKKKTNESMIIYTRIYIILVYKTPLQKKKKKSLEIALNFMSRVIIRRSMDTYVGRLMFQVEPV